MTLSNSYPTKQKILSTKPPINKKTITTTLQWKQEFIKNWNKKTNPQKIKELNILITKINLIYNKNNIKIKKHNQYHYNQQTQTIYHNKNKPSIISSLHELAHHLYGKSETKACSWSIHLYTLCFPQQYKNLTWNNHLLIKK